MRFINWCIFCPLRSRRVGDRDGGERRDWGGRDKPMERRDGGEGRRDKEDRQDNGLTEEEREKRLAEKMPKHKPPEGPVSLNIGKCSNFHSKFLFRS